MARLSDTAHLSKFEEVVTSGQDWSLSTTGWVVAQLREGIAYAISSKANKELHVGGLAIFPPNSNIRIAASVLGRAVIRGVVFEVRALGDFLTPMERRCLESEVAQQCDPYFLIPSDHALAQRMAGMFSPQSVANFTSRVGLVHLFAELVEPWLAPTLSKSDEDASGAQDAKERLRQLLRQIPESEMARLTLGEMARRLHCCERHASRLLREELGMGFLDYLSEIRLKRACQMLRHGNSKIIDVALESGHGSSAHFNFVFKKRFGMTPTAWRNRKTETAPRASARPPRLRVSSLASGIACLLLSLGALVQCLGAAAPRDAASSAPAKFPVDRYEVEGNVSDNRTLLSNSVIASALAPFIGPEEDTNTLAKAQAALESAYRSGGYTDIRVGLPPQPLTNGVIKLVAMITFRLDGYVAQGNTLLDNNSISNLLAPFTGPDVDTNTVAKAQGALQLAYYEHGYPAVSVTIPNGTQITNSTLTFKVIEGKLAVLKILNNRYFSSNNIMLYLPYIRALMATNGIINSRILEAEVNRANANSDRQISPGIKPGIEPGTSALILSVEDRLPLHGRLEWDNYSPPGTPELRVNANVSYGNLWDLEHSVGLQYGFSPEETKPTLGEMSHLSLNPLDGPEVTYYSMFYRAPLGAPAGVSEQIAQDPTHFGYNETTKQFSLPPAIGRPELSFFASRSTTAPTMPGPLNSVVNNTNLVIQQQLISQQDTSQTTVGARLSVPLPEWNAIHSTWSAGLDYKEDKVVTQPTNFFYYTTIVTHGNNSSAPPTKTFNTIAIPGISSYPSLQYVPLFLGWNGSRQDHWGQKSGASELWSQFNGGISLIAGTGGIISKEKSFPVLIGNTPEATTEFVAVRPQISRTQVLPDNFTAYASLSGQWANEPLLNLEQFELGGNGSIRGYREGELYADTGWMGQLEMRSPTMWRGLQTGSPLRVGTQLTAFTDYGEGYNIDRAVSASGDQALWGMGFGLNFTFNHNVQSHILVAWPLLKSAYTTAGHERISFSLSAQL